ncbi:hypothetical protein Ccrd_009135 [Cynara cardunculus var. scolymus]|uniref:Uncharacterized protein n=1 Tax=Cynara cardunculus var. scolymus TaxID=59895 RepID=A0A103YNT0_CYNCS|nr:hypothetical protein Ccrd_009135 [Cynara cardunculus var. scolymus]
MFKANPGAKGAALYHMENVCTSCTHFHSDPDSPNSKMNSLIKQWNQQANNLSYSHEKHWNRLAQCSHLGYSVIP